MRSECSRCKDECEADGAGFTLVRERTPESALSSAASPVAAHARHDHRAARPILLHIMRIAYAHRVRPRIIMRIYALLLVIGRDAKARRRPIDPMRRAGVLWRGLGERDSV